MTIGILNDGDAFIYMKVGVHAREPLEDILRRKRDEISRAGVAFWGYGGSTCHPLTAVQPFVADVTATGANVHLLMQAINSNHFAEQVRADSYSVNGLDWIKIPAPINVLGSRYALVLDSLDDVSMDVSLDDTKVGVGRLAGTAGSNYIKGRVDKACLVYEPSGAVGASPPIPLRLAARLAKPYAVLLK